MNNDKFFPPNFIILPKNVYLNKKLTGNVIRLFGIISAFSNNSKNACYLKNKSLAKILNVEIRHLQNYLSTLKKYNLIEVTYENNHRLIRTFVDKSLYENLETSEIELFDYDWLNDKND